MRDTRKALHWISKLLGKSRVKFVVFGGFAAKTYGADRELADIDIAVGSDQLEKVAKLVKQHTIRGVKHYKDQNWDCRMMTINYVGQEMDIIDLHSTKIFNKHTKGWEDFEPYFAGAKLMWIMGERIKVIEKNKLISYKSKLGRRVDIRDVKELCSVL